jgi:hypothetical protein
VWNLSGDLAGGGSGDAAGVQSLCAKEVCVQTEVASLAVCRGQIFAGCKDRSMRVIGSS